MNEQKNSGSKPISPLPTAQPIVIQQAPPGFLRRWITRLLLIGLVISIMLNIGVFATYDEYLSNAKQPFERYHSGDKTSQQKIVLIQVSGTIMPPFTKRILSSIDKAADDDAVQGVVLVVDSPGGLVADSHQILHRLEKLRAQKPIYVAMKRMAASGGYYIAMGAGPEGVIYAEPTTWTGSIGVIIPRYDLTELSEKFGVKSVPLKTGPFKDSLSPFREMTEAEQDVWNAILSDAFERFLNVIAENRKTLDYDGIKELATGQIYTADQAHQNGMIDKIGYEEDAIEDLQKKLGLKTARIVTYGYQPTLLDLLTGTVQAEQPEMKWQALLEATVPQAMYFCSWAPGIPSLPSK